MTVLEGVAEGIDRPLLGRIAKARSRIGVARRHTILVREGSAGFRFGQGAVLTTSAPDGARHSARVASLPLLALEQLRNGDVVRVHPDGRIEVLWEAGSRHNALMVTNACNCRCVMCPQPCEKDPPDLLDLNLAILRLAEGQSVSNIVLTGGEPTLRMDWLCRILQGCQARFPGTGVSLLTNGRALHDIAVARRIASVGHPALLVCVSLSGDVDSVHDRIMGAEGSFGETVIGLHNLALLRARIELRIVVTRLNHHRLPQLAEYIYWNFPFAARITFMGMEATGVARENLDQLWIDPVEYAGELTRAVRHLRRRDLRVAIYNLPLCLLPRELWGFACDSISTWKKTYAPTCDSCVARGRCPGLFATSCRHSDRLQPILEIGELECA